MSLLPESLSTLANVKEALKITDASQDALLTNIINRATLMLEDQTHRRLVARNYNGKGTVFSTTSVPSEDYIYLDGSRASVNDFGQGEFYLPAYPVQRTGSSVTFQICPLQSRTSAGGEVWSTTTLVENDSFVVDNDTGIVRFLGGPFAEGYRNYRVTCTAGILYPISAPAAPWVPSDLEFVCIETCKTLIRENAKVTSERIGTWSRTYSAMEDPALNEIISRYTRIVL